ncbi:MAG: hypothetical protein IJ877_07660 [Candidatus Gastranaerophilales bacterium]|nr:hypothetical protein [Candidatus Gastranaerophilales bacterium]
MATNITPSQFAGSLYSPASSLGDTAASSVIYRFDDAQTDYFQYKDAEAEYIPQFKAKPKGKENYFSLGIRDRIHDFFVSKREKEDRINRQNKADVAAAIRDMDWYLTYADNVRKSALANYFDSADTYFRTKKLIENNNPIYTSSEHPSFVDIKNDLRVYYSQEEVFSPFSNEPMTVNIPKRVIQTPNHEMLQTATKANIYDYEGGYVAHGARMSVSGALECDSLDIVSVDENAKNDLTFAKMLGCPVSLESAKISSDRKKIQAESMTLFYFDSDDKLIRTKTYTKPTIEYFDDDDKEVFKIDSVACLVTQYSPEKEPFNKAYYRDCYEEYGNSGLDRLISSFLIKFKSEKAASVLLQYGIQRDSNGELNTNKIYKEDVQL